jgi:hypothetical protein
MNAKTSSSRWKKGLSICVALIMVISLLTASLGVPNALRSYIVQGYNVEQVTSLVERYGGRITSNLEIIGALARCCHSRQWLRCAPIRHYSHHSQFWRPHDHGRRLSTGHRLR